MNLLQQKQSWEFFDIPPLENMEIGILYREENPHGHSTNQFQKLPVEGISISGNLVDLTAEITLNQIFRNSEDVPIEILFAFPVTKTSAISDFRVAFSDGTILRGDVEEKKRAADRYDDALAEGKNAFLVEKKDELTYTVNLGRLQPGEEIIVSITYLDEMKIDAMNKRLLFLLPSGLLPPLRHLQKMSHPNEHVLDPSFDQEDQSSLRMEPGDPPAQDIKTECLSTPFGPIPKSDVSAMIHITMSGSLGASLEEIRIPVQNHRDFVQTEITDHGRQARIRLETTRGSSFAQDFIVELIVDMLPLPFVSVENLLTETKDLRLIQEIENGRSIAGCIAIAPGVDSNWDDSPNVELIFVLDCSGSMSGAPIREAKRAMNLFLQSIQPGVAFNLYRFGSSFESFWEESRIVDEQTLLETRSWIDRIDADLGGTELFPVLASIFRSHPLPNRARQIFVLTDGEVNDRSVCIKEVNMNAGSTRVFSIGIGSSVDVQLVSELARAGHGKSSFSLIGNQELASIVIDHLSHAMRPCFTDASISIEDASTGEAILGSAFSLCQTAIPPTFVGETHCIYFFADASRCSTMVNVRLKYHFGPDEFEEEETIDLTKSLQGNRIHTLAAKQRISSLEFDPSLGGVDEILSLSLAYRLGSSITSFIAVSETENPNPIEAQSELRKIDISLQYGYQAREDPVAYSSPDAFDADYFGNIGFSMPCCLSEVADSPDSMSSQRFKLLAKPVSDVMKIRQAASPFSIERGENIDLEAPFLGNALPMSSLSYAPPPRARVASYNAPEESSDDGDIDDDLRQAMQASMTSYEEERDSRGQSDEGAKLENREKDLSERLDLLLMNQSFGGEWKDPEILYRGFGLSHSQTLKDAITNLQTSYPSAYSSEICLTLLVLALLETTFSSRSREWALIRSKAVRFLRGALPADMSVDDSLSLAIAFLRENMSEL